MSKPVFKINQTVKLVIHNGAVIEGNVVAITTRETAKGTTIRYDVQTSFGVFEPWEDNLITYQEHPLIKYLMVNTLEMKFKVISKYQSEVNWSCYGKYQEDTDRDFQSLDNDKIDLLNEGYAHAFGLDN